MIPMPGATLLVICLHNIDHDPGKIISWFVLRIILHRQQAQAQAQALIMMGSWICTLIWLYIS